MPLTEFFSNSASWSSESGPRRIPIYFFCFRPLTFDLVGQCCAELEGKVVFGTWILSDVKLLHFVGNNLGGDENPSESRKPASVFVSLTSLIYVSGKLYTTNGSNSSPSSSHHHTAVCGALYSELRSRPAGAGWTDCRCTGNSPHLIVLLTEFLWFLSYF